MNNNLEIRARICGGAKLIEIFLYQSLMCHIRQSLKKKKKLAKNALKKQTKKTDTVSDFSQLSIY